MLILGALGVLLLATIAAGASTLTPFAFDVSAADPMLQFFPIGPRTPNQQGFISDNQTLMPSGANSVSPADGWELSYSGVSLPLANITFDTLPAGTPKRTSAHPGAKVSLNFTGTGVVFWGNCSDPTGLSATIDYQHPVNIVGTKGVLVNVTDLPYAQHTIELTITSGSVEFYSASMITGLLTDGIPADKVNITTIPTVTGLNKTLRTGTFDWDFNRNAKWAPRWDWAGTVWNHAATTDRSAHFGYRLPANISFVAIYGGTSGWNGDYNITIFSDPDVAERKGMRSQYSLWRGQDVVLWAGPLDPTIKFYIQLTALLEDWWIDVSQVRTWSAVNGTAATGGSNVGAIVGGAVGGGIAALVAVALAIWLLRHHKGAKSQQLDMLDGETYEYQPQSVIGHNMDTPPVGEEHALLTPFPMVQSTATSASTRGSASRSRNGHVLSDGDGVGSSDGTQRPFMRAKAGHTRPLLVLNQETDAGSVVASVPPSYDPQWAAQQGGRVATEALGETQAAEASMNNEQVVAGQQAASVTASNATP